MIGICLIPLCFVILLLVLKNVKIKTIIDGIFLGVVSVMISILITLPMSSIGTQIKTLGQIEVSLLSFFVVLLTVALPEEISKFISIKFGKYTKKCNIFITSILVGTTFACLESIMYINGYGANLALTRVLHPGHLFFQIVMAIILVNGVNVKNKDKIKINVLAILVPAICHAIFNSFNKIEVISYIFYVIGILTYVFVTFYIIKLKIEDEEKIEDKDKNNNKNKSKNKIEKLLPVKIIVIILATLFVFIINSQNVNNNKNEGQVIAEDMIELKVLSAESVQVEDEYFGGKYEKVQVEIKNNGSNIYYPDIFHFKLVDKLNKNDTYLDSYLFEDSLKEVPQGETVTGYLYFQNLDKNYDYLIYTTNSIENPKTYSFYIN